jgi:hypothetical protein
VAVSDPCSGGAVATGTAVVASVVVFPAAGTTAATGVAGASGFLA